MAEVDDKTGEQASGAGKGAEKGASKVTATPAALELLAEIEADHGPVLFHQSGGCCDGSSPMCYGRDEFMISATDVLLGYVGDAPFYISGPQAAVWAHTDLIIDVVTGRGGMFSLDNGRERRFLTRSTICAVAPSS
ncbi:DUF779 domain-containing protein [Amaricoccus sp. W119]|uniref:DUF779 domain-containing protein n=1 Tax=Amaricoccus sp. W119 TaxID=3391833 RepID=UPI0039A5351D